ncbi:hypothetical protein OGY07_06315 [Citrobacter sp. Cs237]|uniref:hypothetical protein n=1 Tax=Citrobacter TaxID=544 RepID=UPI002575FAB0|nr:hypothetical protein [Citrobacter sp. Cs237]MDM2748952.1 hypothetical protein [Citrobacter sp. Cs237]HBU8848566.1 hypothetical protein [Citrobacter sedlakii]
MRLRLALLLSACLSFPALSKGTDWDKIVSGVARGEPASLEQIASLAATANVKQAQELEDALASALTSNTPGALRALQKIDARDWPHMIGSDLVCTVPTERTVEEIDDFYMRTRSALLRTFEGAQCLWILEASFEEWKGEQARQRR